MARIHLIGGEKGGVGKTFVCRSLIQYFQVKNWDFDVIDADGAIGDVSSVYPDATLITLSDNPHRYAEPDVIFTKALQKPVIVNLPSNTLGVLNRWLEQTGLVSLAQEHGVSFLYWFVTDGCHASIKLLQESLDDYNQQLPHLLIRNQGRLNGPDFSYLDIDSLYSTAVQSTNLTQILDFPVLGSAEQYFIDRHHLSLREAQLKIAQTHGIIAAQRIKSFLDQILILFNQINFDMAPTQKSKHATHNISKAKPVPSNDSTPPS